MRVTVLDIRPSGAAFSKGFLEVYTTHPVSPWVVHINFDSSTRFPFNVDVPTQLPFDCLMVNVYVYYTSRLGRSVPNHLGCAFISSSPGTVVARFRSEDGHGDAPFGTVKLGFTHSGRCLLDETAFSETCKAIKHRSKQWYHANEPIEDDLAEIHVPAYPCAFPFLAGFFFAVQHPVDAEQEVLFSRALTAAARRRGWVLLDAMRKKDTACILTAESLGLIVNCNVYNEDCRLDPAGGAVVPNEMFLTDARTLGNGDCEDEAREMCTLAFSLRAGSFASEAVRMAQQALSYYVVSQAFGTVPADGESTNQQYVVSGGRYMAHSFVLFLPVKDVVRMLEAGGGDATFTGFQPGEAPAGLLVQDGIALFDAHPTLFPRATVRGVGLTASDVRVKKYQSMRRPFYHSLTSVMLTEDLVCSRKHKTPVRELAYLTGDEYGATLKDIIAGNTRVKLIPTCVLTSVENELAVQAARYFHPIVPYDTKLSQNPTDVGMLATILGASPARAPPADAYTFFLSMQDVLDATYVRDLARKIPSTFVREYVVDSIAVSCAMVQIFLYSRA